jgi:hypothetical protein
MTKLIYVSMEIQAITTQCTGFQVMAHQSAAEGYGTQNRIFAVNSPVTNADVYCVSVIDILDYANTNKNTTVRTLQGRDTNGTGILALNSGAWYNTAAVTSITLAARVYNPTSISSFALYGIKGGN